MALIALLAISVAVSSAPDDLTLGKDGSARIEVKVTGFFGRALSDATVTLSTNVGTVAELESIGPGTFAATYRPPKQRSPAVALIAADAEVDGNHSLGWLALPLAGSDSLTLQTKPRAKVELRIDGRTFGPVTADARGDATIEVVVPPGVARATMRVTDPLGNVLERPLDLDPPPFPRARVIPVGPARASAADPLEIEVFAINADGSPDRAAPISATADRGEIEGPRRRASVAVLRYRAPASGAGEAHIQISAARQESDMRVLISPAALERRRSFSSPYSAGLFGAVGYAPAGAAVGGITAEVAREIPGLPIEGFVDVGGTLYGGLDGAAPSPYGGRNETATSRALLAQLGGRWSRPFGPGLSVHAALFGGLQIASVTATIHGPPGPITRTDFGVAPHAGVAAGLTFAIGSQRLLVQAEASLAGSTGRMSNQLSSAGMQIGWLYSLNR